MFEFEAIKQAKSQKEIPTDDTKNGVPYIVQSTFNNMFSRNVNKQWLIDNNEAPVSGNRIVLGVTLPAVSYQPREFGASQVITAKANWLNENNGIYIAAAISKLMYQFSYNRKPGMQIYKDMKIQLPTKNGEIDFEFMESFIAELEAEHIAELEAYLLATGLKDYTLTAEEKKALNDFESGIIEWGEYRIEDVLQWQSQKEIDPLKLEELKDETEALYPFYGQSTTNNGIISYHQLTKKVLNNESGKPTILIHSNNQNIVYLETPFYLKDGHGATSVLQSKKLNRINQMFIVASIDKVIKSKYSYNHKATKIELKNSIIQLPTQNHQPDYSIMETLISAIQKLVIKEVVLYADRKIAATKVVVTK